jgi:hypothetical protein
VNNVLERVERLATALTRPGATAVEVAATIDGEQHDDGAPLGVRVKKAGGGIASVSVTRRWQSEEPHTAEVRLDPPLSIDDLQARWGESRSTPPMVGRPDRAVFDGPGSARWSALADLGADGEVRAITLRRDDAG